MELAPDGQLASWIWTCRNLGEYVPVCWGSVCRFAAKWGRLCRKVQKLEGVAGKSMFLLKSKCTYICEGISAVYKVQYSHPNCGHPIHFEYRCKSPQTSRANPRNGAKCTATMSGAHPKSPRQCSLQWFIRWVRAARPQAGTLERHEF